VDGPLPFEDGDLLPEGENFKEALSVRLRKKTRTAASKLSMHSSTNSRL
jgi:hypothetical protein